MPQSQPINTSGLEESNKAAVCRAYLEGMNRGDWKVIDEVFDVNYVSHFRGLPAVHGRAKFKEGLKAWLGAFENMVFKIEDAIAQGDKVAVRWSATGIHAHEYQGFDPALKVPATGKPVSISAIDLYLMAGGKIVEEWNTIDEVAILQQIGASQPKR